MLSAVLVDGAGAPGDLLAFENISARLEEFHGIPRLILIADLVVDVRAGAAA
jgi:hypothetical protein